MEEIKRKNVNGIGAAGYPAAGYETRRTRRNYADQMCNMVPATQSSGGTFELHISNDKDGKAIGSMCMNGSTVVPGDVFDSIKGRDITITFDMGGGIIWSVNGKSITTDKAGDIDFSVQTGVNTVPVDIVNNVTGERYSIQISLAYGGEERERRRQWTVSSAGVCTLRATAARRSRSSLKKTATSRRWGRACGITPPSAIS